MKQLSSMTLLKIIIQINKLREAALFSSYIKQ